MQLSRMIYASCHDDSDVETLDAILSVSRRNNARDHISGALVISEGHFLQVLEGDRTVVAACFHRIMQDARHRDIQVINASDEDHRPFFEWSMHRIDSSRIKQQILGRYTSSVVFNPVRMTQYATLDLCRTLAHGFWEATAA